MTKFELFQYNFRKHERLSFNAVERGLIRIDICTHLGGSGNKSEPNGIKSSAQFGILDN
jgi:hypothetical protein